MIEKRLPYEERQVHIRFEGQSRDIPIRTLDIGDGSSDSEVREALARYLDVSVRKLQAYVVERHTSGNMTVRPEAVFG
jgi:hypothetical protein